MELCCLFPQRSTLYENRLKDLGVTKSVNRFSLKNKILKHFTEAQEQNDRRKTELVVIFRLASYGGIP